MAFLEIRNLKKYFDVSGGLLHAVDDISLDIYRGETLGIVGESGCGKSTLGKLLMRLTTPTSGSIKFDGVEIAQLSPRAFKPYRQRIQMIFQDPFASLDPRMSVSQLIAEPLKSLLHIRSSAERAQRVQALMDLVGIARRFENVYPHELDGGRRQRIGIARALASDPELIICDEPVSALDVSIQAQVLNLLQELQREKKLTYIFITHDLSVVRHISNRVAVMYLGEIVESCETKELFQNTAHPYTKALFSAIPIPDLHRKRERILLHGELASPINPAPGCRFSKRCIHASPQCCQENVSLHTFSPGHLVACPFAEQLKSQETS